MKKSAAEEGNKTNTQKQKTKQGNFCKIQASVTMLDN
jgi:hypothetical protein